MVPPSFTIACRDRLISALSGGPVGSRATFSLSLSAASSQPMARLSAAAGGGVLLTVNAERRVYHRRPTIGVLVSLAGALQRHAQAALWAILDVGAVTLERRDCAADVEPGRVGGAEDEFAGLPKAESDAVDALDARERLAESGDRPEAAKALDDDLGRGLAAATAGAVPDSVSSAGSPAAGSAAATGSAAVVSGEAASWLAAVAASGSTGCAARTSSSAGCTSAAWASTPLDETALASIGTCAETSAAATGWPRLRLPLRLARAPPEPRLMRKHRSERAAWASASRPPRTRRGP